MIPETDIKLTIAKQLWSNQKTIIVNNIEYEIKTSINNCKYVTINGETYIQQDPKKITSNQEKLMKGQQVTRIMRPKAWGLIINNKVIK